MWSIFSRNKKDKQPMVIAPPPTSRVEVELHKGASIDAAKKADAVNQHIKELLVDNGFTLKIAIAAGAQLKQSKTGGKH